MGTLYFIILYTAEPLKDLAAHEEETSFFAPEYAYILNNADMLMSQFKKQPARLERLYGKFSKLQGVRYGLGTFCTLVVDRLGVLGYF